MTRHADKFAELKAKAKADAKAGKAIDVYDKMANSLEMKSKLLTQKPKFAIYDIAMLWLKQLENPACAVASSRILPPMQL